jgi:Flp pilus assembly protein TadD
MLLLKYTSLACLLLLLSACMGNQVKEQVAANVESQVIEIPAQAAVDFKLAIKHLNNAKLVQAQEVLEKMTKDYPQLSGPYANLGVIYSRQKYWPKAQLILESGHEKNIKNIKILNQLGFVYRQSGQFDKAEKSYLKAIKIAPSDPIAYINVGILYDIYMGKFSKASVYYQKYQGMLASPDRKVAGWIVDINRRAGVKTLIAAEVAP